jgi:hypothetical protein
MFHPPNTSSSTLFQSPSCWARISLSIKEEKPQKPLSVKARLPQMSSRSTHNVVTRRSMAGVGVAVVFLIVLLIATSGRTGAASELQPAADVSQPQAQAAAGRTRAASSQTSKPRYSAFEASTQLATPRVSQMASVIKKHFPDLRVSEIRGVVRKTEVQTWLIPGDKTVCFGADNSGGTGYSCGLLADQLRQPVGIISTDEDGTVHASYLVSDDIVAIAVAGDVHNARDNVVSVTYQRGAEIAMLNKDGRSTSIK